jgi:uncharacterized delta-60 repeat protein
MINEYSRTTRCFNTSLSTCLVMVLVLVAVSGFSLNPVYAADGDLDGSFGSFGKVFLSSGDLSAIAIQRDMKIVAVGFGGVIRLNSDGAIDNTFSPVPGGFGGAYYGKAVAIQPDGKIVMAGTLYVANNTTDMGVARYHADGSLDSGFGTGGEVTTDFNGLNDTASALVIQPDGKIVVAGSATNSIGSDFALVRYNSDGQLDSTFGTGGKVMMDFNGLYDEVRSAAFQSDGKIVVAGFASTKLGSTVFGLARYNPDGSLDSGFGTGGKVTTSFSLNNGEELHPANAVVVLPDGKIFAAGGSPLAGNTMPFPDTLENCLAARYNRDGSLDSSFGSGGKAVISFGNAGNTLSLSTIKTLAVQRDGKVVAGGIVRREVKPANWYFALIRFGSGGLDGSFGNGGTVVTKFLTPVSSTVFENDSLNSIAVLPTGRILAAGTTDTGRVLVRYTTSSTAPDTSLISFNFGLPEFFVTEGCTSFPIALLRTGDLSKGASVDYLLSDGTAKERTDYTMAAGTVAFAQGESSKTVNVLITDDAYAEPVETLNITLSNPAGNAFLDGPYSKIIGIVDNDSVTPPTGNPIDEAQTFVGQQYHDLLARQADQGGLDYWTNEIAKCGSDSRCIQHRRIDVSDAFFFETEYQETAAFVYRAFKASFGKQPSYNEFIFNRSGVIGGPNLEDSKDSFLNLFVQRPAFISQYPASLTPEQYVDRLNFNTGNSLAQAQRDVLVTGLKNGMETRATVLRKVADNRMFVDQEYNNYFILTLYFGYLRRDAEAGGFDFWLSQINRYPLRDVGGQHALVCSFITSKEYQERFSSVVTHSNAECPR